MKMWQTHPPHNYKLLNQKPTGTVRKPHKHRAVNDSWGFTFNKKEKSKNYLRTVCFKNSFIYTSIFHLYFTFGSLKTYKLIYQRNSVIPSHGGNCFQFMFYSSSGFIQHIRCSLTEQWKFLKYQQYTILTGFCSEFTAWT